MERSFDFGNSDARIVVSSDEKKGVSAPLAPQQLLDYGRENGPLDGARKADGHPVLEEQVNVRGG
ncbi:hypothetical protein ACIQM3_01740 [Streptomyces sp. NPDC091271]|uniref:hypothetical protein n=1 Tax=Streptomyces sp. NPDC091271 TaxID=3365980 RepID=UPI0037FEA303